MPLAPPTVALEPDLDQPGRTKCFAIAGSQTLIGSEAVGNVAPYKRSI